MQVDILYYQFSNIGKETDEIIYLFSFYKPQSLWILAIVEWDQSDNISDSNLKSLPHWTQYWG